MSSCPRGGDVGVSGTAPGPLVHAEGGSGFTLGVYRPRRWRRRRGQQRYSEVEHGVNAGALASNVSAGSGRALELSASRIAPPGIPGSNSRGGASASSATVSTAHLAAPETSLDVCAPSLLPAASLPLRIIPAVKESSRTFSPLRGVCRPLRMSRASALAPRQRLSP